MKPIKAALAAVAILSMAFTCHAQLYAAKISASLSTQAMNGTTYSVHTVPVTNASIIKAIVTSGSFPGSKASDFDIVYTNSSNEAVEVIETSANNAVVTVLAINGTNSSFNALASDSGVNELDFGTDTDYEFTLPGMGAALVTNMTFKFHYNHVSGALGSFSFSFAGANGIYSPGSIYFQGTIKKGTKVYH